MPKRSALEGRCHHLLDRRPEASLSSQASCHALQNMQMVRMPDAPTTFFLVLDNLKTVSNTVFSFYPLGFSFIISIGQILCSSQIETFCF